MHNKIHKHVQSILVPRDHFSTVQQAARHVEYLGFQPDFKKPHITDNFYRFRQYTPKAGENYRHGQLGADTVIMAKGKQAGIVHPERHMLGKDGHGQLNVYKPPHHNVQQFGERDKMSIYHPIHHNQIPPKGPVHEQFYKEPFNAKKQFDLSGRHKAEQRQDTMRQINTQKRDLKDMRSNPYH